MKLISLFVFCLACSFVDAKDYFASPGKPAASQSVAEADPPPPVVIDTAPAVEALKGLAYGSLPYFKRAGRLRPGALKFAESPAAEGKVCLTVLTQEHCGPCEAYVASLDGQEYAVDVVDIHDPVGMKRVRELYSDCALDETFTPTTLFRDKSGDARVLLGRVSRQELARRLRASNAATSHNAPTAGVGGSFHGRAVIQDMLTRWGKHVGEGREISLKLDRTGLQKISLIHGEDWSVEKFAGKFGHFEIAGDIPSLPIKSVGFAYRLKDGKRFNIDFDPFEFELGEPAAVAYGVDPVTLGFGLYSLGSALYQILNPEVDLTLGGNVELRAWLVENQLHVKFTDAPGVRIQAWVKLDLELQEVAISDQNIHVGFKPQPRNWIQVRERDFAVLD